MDDSVINEQETMIYALAMLIAERPNKEYVIKQDDLNRFAEGGDLCGLIVHGRTSRDGRTITLHIESEADAFLCVAKTIGVRVFVMDATELGLEEEPKPRDSRPN